MTKESHKIRASPDPEDPFDFDGPEIIKCKGCKIKWKRGKNVTMKSVKEKGKGGKGVAKTVVKLVKTESFFDFFSHQEIPDDPKAEMNDEDRSTLVLDYDEGFSIKEKFIPRAVLYFTGEVMTQLEQSSGALCTRRRRVVPTGLRLVMVTLKIKSRKIGYKWSSDF